MSKELAIEVVLPAGALGRVDDESPLDSMLRTIGEAIEKSDPKQRGQWAEKYGAYFDCDEFMMHPYCWCERSECPWCRGCECPKSAYHYFVDGNEVAYDEYDEFYEKQTGKFPEIKDFAGRDYGGFDDDWEPTKAQRTALDKARRAHAKRGDAANKRRSVRHDPVCEFCTKYGGKTEPNFHHKPTGLKVWWYKYIGRGMEVESGTATNVAPVLAACLNAIP